MTVWDLVDNCRENGISLNNEIKIFTNGDADIEHEPIDVEEGDNEIHIYTH